MPTVPGPQFVDVLLRESLIRTASIAAGLRRALAPEVRNRIRFEMKREVKRSRKQRKLGPAAGAPRVGGAATRLGPVVRRGFWFAAGAAAGVYGMVKTRRVAEAFTTDGLRDRASAASVGVADVP